METLPNNPPDLVAATTPTGTYFPPSQTPSPPLQLSTVSSASTLVLSSPPKSHPIHTTQPHSLDDKNKNKLQMGDSSPLKIDIEIGQGNNGETGENSEFLYENKVKFYPSTPKDLDVLKNIRKVFVSRLDEPQCAYKVTNECGEGVFETMQGETSGGIWSRYFRQQQKVILIKDRYQHCVLKLDFGRSRTVACCQTLRFAALTAHYKSKSEEPLCVIFKDRGCCIYSCCSSGVTYENAPQMDAVAPFTVKTKRQWRNRAEFMVKHSDGTILAFIDKEKKSYTLTMGENLKPTMKACLVGFVVAMDIMDREDAGRLNCYLRPSTYVTILFLLMLFFMIGAFLFHFVTAMVLSWPRGGRPLGCNDEVHAAQDDPFLPANHTHVYKPHNVTNRFHNLTISPDI